MLLHVDATGTNGNWGLDGSVADVPGLRGRVGCSRGVRSIRQELKWWRVQDQEGAITLPDVTLGASEP